MSLRRAILLNVPLAFALWAVVIVAMWAAAPVVVEVVVREMGR